MATTHSFYTLLSYTRRHSLHCNSLFSGKRTILLIMTQDPLFIRRALLSVSDKTHLLELAHGLREYGIELLATGGTAELLKKAQIPYQSIESFTGNPETFDGRMKTISFKLEGALLYDRNNSSHVEQAKALHLSPIDCVICNFYPFPELFDEKQTDKNLLIDQIDIGGPTMVRAAAKNYLHILVVVSPNDYPDILTEIKKLSGAVSLNTRKKMMQKAFELTYKYDQNIYETFSKTNLRYGENPHQKSFFIADSTQISEIEWDFESHKQLSYNNILDASTAYKILKDIKNTAPIKHGVCVIVKHNIPCGIATAPTIEEAFKHAWSCDPVSAFGGIAALSSTLTHECINFIENKFLEVLLAPNFEEGVLEILTDHKKNLRVLKTLDMDAKKFLLQRVAVEGGTLIQQEDQCLGKEQLQSVTLKHFPAQLNPLAQFGIQTTKWLKSNAVAIVSELEDKGFTLISQGAGQPNRVDTLKRLTIPKAKEKNIDLSSCVLVSDAFFPFPDSIEEAHRAGIQYIVQPGGSIRDKEVIGACNKLGIAMAFTGQRHFKH